MAVVGEEDKRPRQHMNFHFLFELYDVLQPLLFLQTDAGNAGAIHVCSLFLFIT